MKDTIVADLADFIRDLPPDMPVRMVDGLPAYTVVHDGVLLITDLHPSSDVWQPEPRELGAHEKESLYD
jgi:hypothetical protein